MAINNLRGHLYLISTSFIALLCGEAIRGIFGTIPRRISLHLPIVWSRRVATGYCSLLCFLLSCYPILCLKSLFLFSGFCAFECCLWWNLHAKQA